MKKLDKDLILAYVNLIILGIIVVGIIGLSVYVLIVYGGRPLSELPAWVIPFFLKR